MVSVKRSSTHLLCIPDMCLRWGVAMGVAAPLCLFFVVVWATAVNFGVCSSFALNFSVCCVSGVCSVVGYEDFLL